MASQVTSLTIVNSTAYSGTDQRKHQTSASLAFVRGIHRWPLKSPHEWPLTEKMSPFNDVIMIIHAYKKYVKPYTQWYGICLVYRYSDCTAIRVSGKFYWLRDWDKFIQHNMTLYRCMISDIHDSSYVLFRTNLISNTSLHVGRPLLRPCLVAYAEATLARQKDSATNEKCWHHFRILIVDKWSVVWNECKKSWVPNDRLEKPLIPCNMISN